MKLTRLKTINLTPTSPFTFDPTFHKPDHFTSGDNYWEPNIRWQTWNFKGNCLGIKFENKGTVDNPKIAVHVYSREPLSKDLIDNLISELKYSYNLDLDLSDFYNASLQERSGVIASDYKKFKDEKILGPIIKKWRGMRPGHQSSLYEYLIIGIVLQNATVRRSIQMFKALLESYGTLLKFNDKELWCFWNPGSLKKVSEDDLRALKVGYRAKAIKIIDDQFSDGILDEMELRKKDRETQMKELLKIYGVGPATVWYLLFDVFHHWDFFNHVSPWEQKIYSKLFFDKDPENPVPVDQILKHFEKFGEYRQLAVHYIWEDLWWKRKNENIPWLEKLIRV